MIVFIAAVAALCIAVNADLEPLQLKSLEGPATFYRRQANSSSATSMSTQPPSTANSTSPNPTLPIPGSSPSPAPWNVTLVVSEASFDIGNYDPSQFVGMLNAPCGPDGCSGGEGQSFSFEGVSGDYETSGDGTITIDGFVYNNQDWTNVLVNTLNAAWQNTTACTTQTVKQHSLKCPWDSRKRDHPQCTNPTVELTTCTMANSISATLWDGSGNLKGHIEMNAASHLNDPSPFDCNAAISGMTGAATAVEANPVGIGALIIANVICGVVSGS